MPLPTVGRVADREKRLIIVFRRELTKTRRNEAELAEARILTMFWEVITVNYDVTPHSPLWGAINERFLRDNYLS